MKITPAPKGELLETAVTVGSGVALTSGAAKSIASLELPAGNFEVSGVGCFSATGGSTITGQAAAVHTVADTMPLGSTGGLTACPLPSGGATAFVEDTCLPCGPIRVTGPTTVYLTHRANFSGITMKGYGRLRAISV